MFQGRSLVILCLAIVLGLAAVIIANAYFSGVEQRDEREAKGMVKIAVARVPLDFGDTITIDKFRLVAWPAWSVPEGTFTSAEQLMPAGKTHVVLRPIAANEPILNSKLSGEGGRATLAALLRPDMRAFAVRVTDVSGVAGFALPGDVVDVLVTRTSATSTNGEQITDVLLQNVRVVAIDQDPSDSKSDPRVGKTATLEVSQSDSQKLALAQQVGSISLALKKASDEVRPLVETVGVEDLRDYAYAGGYSGPVETASSASSSEYRAPRRYRVVTKPRRTTSSVEIVRGIEAKNYEVGRYVGY